jgi:hypothetical protein
MPDALEVARVVDAKTLQRTPPTRGAYGELGRAATSDAPPPRACLVAERGAATGVQQGGRELAPRAEDWLAERIDAWKDAMKPSIRDPPRNRRIA